jgi:ribosomal-protein-alanine N-acetyltransferase
MQYSHKNHILLRKVENSDLSSLLEYKRESWQGTHKISLLNSLDQQNWFQRVTSSLTTLVLIAENAEPVSVELLRTNPLLNDDRVGLYILDAIDWPNGSYEMSYGVFGPRRGKGFGTRIVQAGVDFGFEIMNFRRVGCECLVSNPPSINCIERAGFVREGIKRKAVHRCGEEIDSIVYGLLRSEWVNKNRTGE